MELLHDWVTYTIDDSAVPIIWSFAYLYRNLLLKLPFHHKYLTKQMQFLSHTIASVEIIYDCKVGLLLMYVKVSNKPQRWQVR